jgi:predicted nucleic acid-binding protein
LSSFLLDTSFLISFADPRRPHHSVAKSYIIESVRRGSPLYLSAIVASEFQVKQPVTDLPLRNLVVLPFNIDHAMTAGILMRSLQRDANDDRGNVKDDVKLIAQTVCESIPFILTEDQNTLAKYLKRLNDSAPLAYE